MIWSKNPPTPNDEQFELLEYSLEISAYSFFKIGSGLQI